MDSFNSAVILAGGKSSRMEFDKQLLVINNKRLVYEIAEKLEKQFEEIIIVTNKKEYYEGCKYKLVSDNIKNMGPLAGISVGLKESSSNYVYIIACDMPNIDNDYISYIKNKVETDIQMMKTFDIYISKINDRIELFQGFYKKELSSEIENYLMSSSKKSIISFFERTNKKVSYIENEEFKKNKFNQDIFVNLNTKQDLNIYEKENYKHAFY